jgi:DNA-binding PadR family transcriptional regulator
VIISGSEPTIDAIDLDIFRIMITKGYTSGYAIWSQMKRENDNVIAYKNVGRRILLLHKQGFIDEIKLESDTVPWRKDYKLTMKGLEQLIPYIQTHFEQLKTIVDYMEKFNLDIEAFSHLLFSKFDSIRKLVSKYENLTTADYDREVNSEWLSGKDLEQSETSFGIFSKNRQKALVKDLVNQIKEGLMEFDPDTLTLVRTKKGRKVVSVPMIKLTASLLADMNLSPSTMQLQKEWEEEEEEFQYEEKLQSELSKGKKKKH